MLSSSQFAIVLAAAEPAASGNPVSFAEGLTFWTIVTFLLVAIFLRAKVWGPLMKMLDERESSIQSAIDAARHEREQAQKLLAEQQEEAQKARREAAELVRKSQTEVERAKEELFAKARAEAEAMIESARKQIAEERRKAVAEIRDIAVDLAIAAAGRLVSRELDDEAHRKLAEEFVSSVQKEGSSSLGTPAA